jgi:hypothetical protein
MRAAIRSRWARISAWTAFTAASDATPNDSGQRDNKLMTQIHDG